MSWLIDTGASTNVLNTKWYTNIDSEMKPALQQVESVLRSVDGTPLEILGETNVDVQLARQVFNVPVVVADIGELDGIIGMKFLSEQNAIIDVFHGSLRIDNTEIFMHRQEIFECCRVRLSEDIIIEPDQEKLIYGQGDRKRWNNRAKVGMIEPVNSFIQSTGLLVCNAITKATDSNILLTCANLSDDTITVKKGTTVALMHPIENVINMGNKLTIRILEMSRSKTYLNIFRIWCLELVQILMKIKLPS